MIPSKYSPFNKKGEYNQGYLFKIPKAVGSYIISKIPEALEYFSL